MERIQPVQLTIDPEHQRLTDLLDLVTSFAGEFYHLRRCRKTATKKGRPQVNRKNPPTKPSDKLLLEKPVFS